MAQLGKPWVPRAPGWCLICVPSNTKIHKQQGAAQQNLLINCCVVDCRSTPLWKPLFSWKNPGTSHRSACNPETTCSYWHVCQKKIPINKVWEFWLFYRPNVTRNPFSPLVIILPLKGRTCSDESSRQWTHCKEEFGPFVLPWTAMKKVGATRRRSCKRRGKANTHVAPALLGFCPCCGSGAAAVRRRGREGSRHARLPSHSLCEAFGSLAYWNGISVLIFISWSNLSPSILLEKYNSSKQIVSVKNFCPFKASFQIPTTATGTKLEAFMSLIFPCHDWFN